MGFDPQTADKPLVNVRKRTTKVNISMAISVVIFFLIGAAGIFLFHQREKNSAPSTPPAERGK